MNLETAKPIYVLSCLAMGLIILSPTVAMLVRFPADEKFSEVWVLGADHMMQNYPFTVIANGTYKVYVGVSNHMDAFEYYRICVKLRNQTESEPNRKSGSPSLLNPLYEFRRFLKNGGTQEAEVPFSFVDVSVTGDVCHILQVTIGGQAVNVDKQMLWDQNGTGFFCQLFFELWYYSESSSDFQYSNRFVGIWLNVTATYLNLPDI